MRRTVPPAPLPRRNCRGLIEATLTAALATLETFLPRRNCRGLIEAFPWLISNRPTVVFRGVIAAASLKLFGLFSLITIPRRVLPRRNCRGLIEAVPFGSVRVCGLINLPRRNCRGLIE